MKIDLMYPSKYVAASDLNGRTITLVINDVQLDDIPMAGGRREKKVVVTFAKAEKQFIAGKTNGLAMALLLGEDSDQWIGKRVTIAPDVDMLKREAVPCIRVVGSPDASPERAAAFKVAWAGERQRGKLVDRIKQQLRKMATESGRVNPLPTEPEPVTPPDPSDDHPRIPDGDQPF